MFLNYALYQIMNTLALFDFDKTIINKDTGLCFVIYALNKNVIRSMTALLITPVVILLFLSTETRFIGNSIYLWLATACLNNEQIKQLRSRFIKQYMTSADTLIYQSAIDAIRTHLNYNHTVIVISGASQWMLEQAFEQLKIDRVKLIGSDEHAFLSGMVSNYHCFHKNKIKRLNEWLILENNHNIIGYSDSSADIPMLTACNKRYIINPKKRCLKKFKRAFSSDFEVLQWN
jgi:phosphatidylglycerophosphatase C